MTIQEIRLSMYEERDPRWYGYEEQGEEAFIAWWGHKSDGCSDEKD